MKAKTYYGEFNYQKELETLITDLVTEQAKLKIKSALNQKILELEFPCKVQFAVWYESVDFYAPIEEWPSEDIYRECITLIRRCFDIKMLRREFASYSGKYKWCGTFEYKGKMKSLIIHGIPKPPECQIVQVSEVVTKYKSVCEGETK